MKTKLHSQFCKMYGCRRLFNNRLLTITYGDIYRRDIILINDKEYNDPFLELDLKTNELIDLFLYGRRLLCCDIKSNLHIFSYLKDHEWKEIEE